MGYKKDVSQSKQVLKLFEIRAGYQNPPQAMTDLWIQYFGNPSVMTRMAFGKLKPRENKYKENLKVVDHNQTQHIFKFVVTDGHLKLRIPKDKLSEFFPESVREEFVEMGWMTRKEAQLQ